MAQEDRPDSQEFANLTNAIIPSNIYFRSWDQASTGQLPLVPADTMSSDLTWPNASHLNNTTPPSDPSSIPMRFTDPGLSNAPALSANSLPQLLASSGNQYRVDSGKRKLKEHQSVHAIQGLPPTMSEVKTEPSPAKDPLSALKMKAKESVMAKRAQSIRSASRDSRTVIAEVSRSELTQGGGNDHTTPAERPDSLSSVTTEIQGSYVQTTDQTSSVSHVRMKGMTVEVEDLLAEGRAAASVVHGQQGSAETLQPQHERTVQDRDENRLANSELEIIQGVIPHDGQEANSELQVAGCLQALPTSELDEINTWLTMTGFYDIPYRDKILSRRRRLKELEEEKLRLLEEEQADQQFRGSYQQNTETLAYRRAYLPASVSCQPPPRARRDAGLRIKDSASISRSLPEKDQTSSETPRKRRMEEATTDNKALYTTKAARTELYPRPPPTSLDSPSEGPRRASIWEKFGPKSSGTERHGQASQDRETYDRRVREREVDHRSSRNWPQGRDRARSDSREHPPLHYDSAYRVSYPPKLDSRSGRVRFFLLKSWNYENIMTAQRENTWATQIKNEEAFVGAFETCRHVIFIFSANHSKAFQGYARMEGLPGERGVELPSWIKNLRWPTTAPFRIQWLVTAETPYRAVGNLKNPLNEDLPIFVGRDGQEIPEELGDQVCEIIDEDSAAGIQSRH